MKRSLASLPVLIAFAIGLLLGAAAGVRYETRVFHKFWQHGPNRSRMLARLSDQLGLSPRQREELGTILGVNHKQVMDLHRQMAAQFDGIRESFRQNLGNILTPDQQKKFAAMTAQWDARRKALTATADAASQTAPTSSDPQEQ